MPDRPAPMGADERERLRIVRALLIHVIANEASYHDGEASQDIAEAILDAILATTDALAALVDWPSLLAAGERAGRVGVPHLGDPGWRNYGVRLVPDPQEGADDG